MQQYLTENNKDVALIFIFNRHYQQYSKPIIIHLIFISCKRS